MAERVIRRRNRANVYSDEMLLDAATDVFHRRGFHESSMLDIAHRAGVTKPTLYARFGSKEAIYDRVMERIGESLVHAMTAAFAGVETATAEEATRRPVKAFFDWVRAHPAWFHLLFASDQGAPTGVDHGGRALAGLTGLVTEASAAFLRGRGMPSGRVTGLIAANVVGVMHSSARWAVDHDALDRVDLSGFVTTLVLNGLEGVDPAVISTLRPRRRIA
jgi:AcrR family transcriptional regulator